jgi:hypothetical protein
MEPAGEKGQKKKEKRFVSLRGMATRKNGAQVVADKCLNVSFFLNALFV